MCIWFGFESSHSDAHWHRCAFQFTSVKPPRDVALMRIRLADPALRVIMWQLSHDCKMQIMAACKAIIVFFHRVSSQSPAIPSPVIPSILKAQLSAVKQQNEDRTASHSISVWFYSNPSCTIIITHRPRLSKGSVNVIKHIWCAMDSISPDAHSEAHYSVNTQTC